jgi:hypothetical protein
MLHDCMVDRQVPGRPIAIAVAAKPDVEARPVDLGIGRTGGVPKVKIVQP